MAKAVKEVTDIQKIRIELEKKFGLSTVTPQELTVVSTGSYTLDKATGINGYPLGKIIEMFGPESSGKSTLTLHAMAEFQKKYPEKDVYLFDYENSFDKMYASSLGVDVDKLIIYQPDSQEQGYDMILGLAEKGIASLIIIDSHTSAIPKVIIEGDMSDATMAVQARNNSKFLGKIKGLLTKTGTTIIAISQTRADLGGMGKNTGDISTGGKAWKFYADMRMKIWKSLKKEDELNRTTVDVIKNKCAPPFGKAEFDIAWGEGINNFVEILELGVGLNIIKQSGSWFSLIEDGTKLGQGKNGVTNLWKSNPEFFEDVKNKVLRVLDATVIEPVIPADDVDIEAIPEPQIEVSQLQIINN